jgi:nucleoid DNA-binding protein
MPTVTKKDFIDRIASSTRLRREDVKLIVLRFLDDVVEELGKGNRLEFRDFGVLVVRSRAPRLAQNPRTLQQVSVPAKRTVKFKPGRKLRDRLDGTTPPRIVVQPDVGERVLGKRGGRKKAN